jgi:type IV pilus assembly protein PilY1
MTHRHHRSTAAGFGLVAAALLATASGSWAADIDIYGAPGASGAPNVLFFLDNTSNWSAQSNAWTPGSSWDKCKNLDAAAVTACKAAIQEVFYVGLPANEKRPWEGGFKDWNASKSPTQGQVELRALRFVLKALVCEAGDDALKVNVGLSMFSPTKGSALGPNDPSAFIYHAVKPLTGTPTTGNCKALLDKLDNIDKKINDPATKAPSDANYGAALYEAFKYFGGHTNPNLAPNPTPNGGSPVGRSGYGPQRFSVPQVLDDPAAFVSGNIEYRSPLDDSGNCGNNYLVLVGNTYPNKEPKSGPLPFQGINYTPPALSLITSDTDLFADEWAYFLSNTDIHPAEGIQRLFSYHVNVYNDCKGGKCPDQAKLLKSMAAVGGVGSSGYVEVGGDLLGLIKAFESILVEIAAVNSVFTATTLPVSTTTQGTYLNQVFVGSFRPEGNAGPRWVGNLKQYELGFVNGVLDLLDAKRQPAVLTGAGFFSPLAESYWTEDSVFFAQSPAGTPPSKSDRPDGPLVDKGGAAQMLRKNNLQNANNRKVYTLPSAPAGGTALSTKPFSTSNTDVTSAFSAAEIAWIRGQANVTTGEGVEEFVGTYLSGSTETLLGTTGARHSIHGDVLHSRPVALNYGNGEVVVYYGANDGHFRAVDGRKTGGTAGHELWSFVAPEHYAMLRRQRAGTPTLHLPETDSLGGAVEPADGTASKDYAMDGPIGVYARYKSGAVTEAILYPTMRRGGKAVYAFDVTTKDNPTFKWKIKAGDSGFEKLAQTWSMPKPVALDPKATTPPVLLLMGGGYDPAEDTNGSGNIGNVIYVVNGRTGGLVAALPTEFSVPSDVTVVDTDENGVPDRAYVADVRGNLYRVDFPKEGDLLVSTTWASTEAIKIAALGGKAFYPPDVVVTNKFIAVLQGTGDREKPLLVSTSDNFFLIKDTLGDPRVGEPLTKADLTRVAKIDNATMQPTSIVDPVSDDEGCYLELATNGEKVVNAPFTIAGVTYFGTNRPKPSNPNACSADLGEAYAYKFPLFCGVPTSNQLVGGGLPPSPVGGIVELIVDGQTVKVPFIIGGGEGGNSFKPGEPRPPVPPIRTRLNWRIDNSNR